MLEPISSLALSNTIVSKLRDNGFHCVEDIKDSKVPDKCADEFKEAQRAWKVPAVVSALDVLQEESLKCKISTFSRALDDILEGGFHCGTVTELCGAPSSGKTQICLQISVGVRSSRSPGRVVYIDTRSGLSSLRLKDMARGIQRHFKEPHFNESELTGGITVLSPRTADDLLTVVCNLRKVSTEDPQVRLVVVDSLSFLVQSCLDDASRRTKLYFRILDELQDLSVNHNLAVVVTNEMTTEMSGNSEAALVGAGGQLLAHREHRRLMLARIGDHKFAARTLKTCTIPEVSVLFQVTPDGIRDVVG